MRKSIIFLLLVILATVSFAVPTPKEIFNQTKYYEALYRDFPVGIAFVDKDGAFLSANSILCSFLGRSEDELKRLSWQSVTVRQDIEADESASLRVMSGEDRSYTIFKQYIHKRGDSLWARLTVIGIKNQTGEFEHFISIVEPLSNSTFFEADIYSKLKEIQGCLTTLKTTTDSSFGSFFINNWATLIPWTMVIIISVGGILLRIQLDSHKIKELEEKFKENGKND
jgi:PAS domain S-box-containing protein